MKSYESYSYWLETCGDDLTPRPALNGSIDADVAILGAGFTGLWTAYYLLQHDPSLKIVIVEAEIAGFGASGRNGGWCTSSFPTSLDKLASTYGRDQAIAMHNAMSEAVNEIGKFAASEQIDIQWKKAGALRIARGPSQLPAIHSTLETFQRYGFHDEVRLLDKIETDERVRIAGTLGSVWSKNTAVIHPGRLVRGLARTVERMGAVIYEQTPVTGYTSGAYPALHTEFGHVRANTLAICGEAYLSALKGIGRQIVPVYSLITLTEPLSDSDWASIGWDQRECVSSCRYTVDYLSKTADGRILFGGRGAPYHVGSKIKDAYDHHEDTHQRLMNNVREWFPMLQEVQFTHTWGGPLGWPRDFMPTFSYDRKTNVASSRGYTGNGVATANLGGRTIAELILGLETSRTPLPPVNHHSPNWEPEPLRFLGIRYVQRSYWNIDMEAQRTGKAPTNRTLAERLTRH